MYLIPDIYFTSCTNSNTLSFLKKKILKCILIFFPSTFQVYSISDQNVLDARHQSQTDLTNKSAKPKKKKKSSKAIKTPKLVKVFIKRK